MLLLARNVTVAIRQGCVSADESTHRLRREALELVLHGRSIPDVAASLRVSPQTLRNWRRQDERDRGERDDGLTSVEREELRLLRRENARLKQERDILKHATAFFARETGIR